MAEDILRIQITGDAAGASGAIAEVSSQAKVLSSDLKSVGAAGEEAGSAVAAGMETANRSISEARHSAMLMSEEMGIKMPRALSTVLAKSETIGPALNAAFSAVVALAFIEIIVKVAEKIGDLYNSLVLLADQDKAASEATAAMSKAMEENETRLDAAQKALERYGLSADKVAKLKIADEQQAQTEKLNTTMKEQAASIEKAAAGWQMWFRAVSDATFGTELLDASMKKADADSESLINSQRKTVDVINETANAQDKLVEKQAAHKLAVETAADLNRTDQDWQNYADIVQKSLDKANKELEAGTAKTDQLLLSMTGAVNENEIGFTLLKKASDDVNASLNAGTVVEANAIKMIQQQAAASEKAKQALLDQQQALDSLGGRMNAILNTNELMTKGWDAFGKTAVKNLEDVGASLVKHLAIALLTDNQQKLGAAKLAAANAYASVSAVPVVGWVMAPLAAASAFAGAMAFDQGGIVPENGSNSDSFTALVRPREMILPAPVSDVVQDMAASASGRSGGGDIHIHALDSQSFEHALKRNSSALAAGIDHMYDRGHSSIRKNARGK